MELISSWEQIVSWLVLLVVLITVVSGKIRYDVSAFGGLLFLGLLGLRKPSELFSGFASPALFTVGTVLVMSAGIVESGLLTGLGKKIASKIKKTGNQILAIFLTTGLMSAFMNNVGAIGVTLPTAKRMARRENIVPSSFGIPIAFASILGGSLTLIGTSSNLIVSTYRLNAYGEPFKMFDFTFHGLAVFGSGIFIVFLCRLCGIGPIAGGKGALIINSDNEPDYYVEKSSARVPWKNTVVVISLLAAVILTGAGLIHPSIGFGLAVILWLGTGILSYNNAIENINIPVLLFLGSMLGISGVLEETGALSSVINVISPFFDKLSPFWLILILLYMTALFANILNNVVAAVLMAPVAIGLARAGGVSMNPDALLMAVAAGASLGIVMPTHQSTIVVMNSMELQKKEFITTGFAILVTAGILSTFVIYFIWG